MTPAVVVAATRNPDHPDCALLTVTCPYDCAAAERRRLGRPPLRRPKPTLHYHGTCELRADGDYGSRVPHCASGYRRGEYVLTDPDGLVARALGALVRDPQ